ncbi:hypothetical protein H0W91_00320 [Patescibacteria group bacterium]|nr:hypothetical protein [Patescibacteria group bacterium]
MSRVVLDIKTKKDRQGILKKIKKWEVLRLQPEELIRRKILIQVLNGIWKAYSRGQKSQSATVWIAAESFVRTMSPSRYVDLAKRLCVAHFPLIVALGYEIEIIEEDEKYVLYQSRLSRVGDPVMLMGIKVSNTHIHEALTVRKLLFRETKLLPATVRNKAWKKRKRARKKNSK